MNQINTLTLSVINSELLQGDSTVSSEFDVTGGVVGSAASASWRLTDHQNSVLPEHASIDFTDGCFRLHDLHGRVFINDSLTPVGYNRHVRLSPGDTLHIGIYHIAVNIGEMKDSPDLESLTGQRNRDELSEFLASGRNYASPAQHQASDPLSALTQGYHSAISTPDNIEQHFIDLPLSADGRSRPDTFAASGDELLRALAQGIGQMPDLCDDQQQQEMLREMGRMMRATLEGLLKLRSEQVALADKQLRPIEDNPLRLGLDYSATLALLFGAEKSPVHLSASAAVSEVLTSIRIHHTASQQATSIALQSLLQAFSPQILLERFRHYQRSEAPLSDSDAWQMYQQYFQELTSPRQQGFQRLFQQVYHQVYDRLIREQQEQH